MDFLPHRPVPEDFRRQKGEWRQPQRGFKHFPSLSENLQKQGIQILQQGGFGAKEEESGYRQYPRQWEEYVVGGVGREQESTAQKERPTRAKAQQYSWVHYPRPEEEKVVEGYGKVPEQETQAKGRKQQEQRMGTPRKGQVSKVHYPRREEEYVVSGVGVGRGYTDDDNQIFLKEHAPDQKYVAFPRHCEYVVEGTAHGSGHGDEKGKQVIRKPQKKSGTSTTSTLGQDEQQKQKSSYSTVKYPRREEEHIVSGMGMGQESMYEQGKPTRDTQQATPGFGPQRQWGSGTTESRETTGGKYGRPKKLKTKPPTHILDEIPKAAEEFHHKKGTRPSVESSERFGKPKRAQTH